MAGTPPRFGVTAGSGFDISIPFPYIYSHGGSQVGATMRKATSNRWDFETAALATFGGVAISIHRKRIERTLTLQVPLLGTFWWNNERTGLHMGIGGQVGFLVWGWSTTYYEDGDNEIEYVKPDWMPWRRQKSNDYSVYRFPVSVGAVFRLGYQLKRIPLDISFISQQYLINHQRIFYPHYTGVSFTWWF